jgi:DNA-binding NarL/FixJ family response regulator
LRVPFRPPARVNAVSIRVYLIEDHQVMREALADFLAATPDIELCGSAETAEQAESELGPAEPAVVLLDLSLPGRSGLDFLAEIQRRWQLPCVILSGHRERSHVEKAFEGGARGYVLKGSPADVPTAIRQVISGKRFLSESLRTSLGYDVADKGT